MRIILSTIGVFIGLTIPFSWLVGRAYFARQSWWDKWLKEEFSLNGNIYIVIGATCVVVLGLIGYFMGRRFEGLEKESLDVQDSNIELSHLAATDSLTGLYNGRTMDERLTIGLGNAHKSPLSCLSIDIDHFKKINDQHGHPFGDEVLVRISSVLKSCVRRIDAVGRLGGEEFLIILPDTASGHAATIADRIREAVRSQEFISDNNKIQVSVSVGVADSHMRGLSEKSVLLKAADDALYRAKNAGRNKTMIWSD